MKEIKEITALDDVGNFSDGSHTFNDILSKDDFISCYS